jgi:translation initiation factor 1
MPRDDRPIVYSSAYEDLVPCPKCKKIPCVCKEQVSLPPYEQIAHIRRETKGRGGRTVITISNLKLTDEDLKKLSRDLKKGCNTGGTIKDGILEIQGDHRQKINQILRKLGYQTKFTGG